MAWTMCRCGTMVIGDERCIVSCSACGTANKLPVGFQTPTAVNRRCEECGERLRYRGYTTEKHKRREYVFTCTCGEEYKFSDLAG